MTRIAIKKILKVLMIFIVVAIIFGIFKIELVLRFIDFRVIPFARLTSYLTLLITTILSFITLSVCIYGGYLTLVLTQSDITPGPYSESVIWLVWMYSLNEIAKTFIFYFSIPKYVMIKTAPEILNLVYNSTFRVQSFYSDIIFIISGILIYSFVLKKNNQSISLLSILVSSLTLSANLIFSHFI